MALAIFAGAIFMPIFNIIDTALATTGSSP
jgi:hypothetical protein